MTKSSSRVVWAVLSASLTLLVSVAAFTITLAVSSR
jgi:hypothetical protein